MQLEQRKKGMKVLIAKFINIYVTILSLNKSMITRNIKLGANELRLLAAAHFIELLHNDKKNII
jgi:hypothetical protein